ncbi:diguanylate cyclase (GGDEF)-like protein [Aequitasia blattaphilus]|uniref:GGDEF domain-containing protein n=1 Tax=Aequitasia blattaphilus TaxID=2949332 RepID=A0ABT1E7U9_9FIRM|nr:GGDEF domain-containing protein [Aequitasia blattaphilus]MCP1101786.1 GGDEF domain-containing protein [Aequitasia blattaphilus]MCR8614426.1 GGDEF domain-containing protein [Aequitasia blattaphilus]
MTAWNYIFGTVPKEYAKEYHETKLGTNLKRTLGFSIYIIGLQILLNILNAIKPDSESYSESVVKYIVLSMVLLCVGIIYLILSILIQKKVIQNRLIVNSVPYSLLYLYVIIQMIFLYFNLHSDNGYNSYIIAIIITAFFMVTSPFESIMVILVSFVAAIAMSLDGKERFTEFVMNTDVWANVLIITALCCYMSVIIHQMYLNNFMYGVKLRESNEKLQDTARTDSLTGVWNRRGFYNILDQGKDKKEVESNAFVILMCDVDFFKRYNDRNGHLEGDACLMKVAQTLKATLEEYGGEICRYGGEEFLGYYETEDVENITDIAEKCRENIEARNMMGKRTEEDQDGGPITISIGVAAVYKGEVIDIDELIKTADGALYKAKEQGRNQVVFEG